MAEGGSQDKLERPLVFCPELGLTIEQLRDGFTLDSLWQVLPPETNKKSLQIDWNYSIIQMFAYINKYTFFLGKYVSSLLCIGSYEIYVVWCSNISNEIFSKENNP